MPPNPSCPGSVRSEADINDDIRDLWQQVDGRLTDAQQAVYRRLLAEYLTVVQARPTA